MTEKFSEDEDKTLADEFLDDLETGTFVAGLQALARGEVPQDLIPPPPPDLLVKAREAVRRGYEAAIAEFPDTVERDLRNMGENN